MQKVDTPLKRILALRTGEWLVAETEAWHEKSLRSRDDPGWFHPSNLSDSCDASLLFQFLGLKQQVTHSARTQRIFDNGHCRDRYWKEYLHKAGISLVQKDSDRLVELPELRIRGECDDLVKNRTTGESYVFEFKTMNHEQFKALREPPLVYKMQVHPYMRHHHGWPTYFLFEDKNDQELKPFIYQFDPAIWDGIERRLKNILEQARNGIMVERTPLARDSGCSFYRLCSGFVLLSEHVEFARARTEGN